MSAPMTAKLNAIGRLPDEPVSGVWIAYHLDWSGFVVFANEVDALRYAVERTMSVKYVEFGADAMVE